MLLDDNPLCKYNPGLDKLKEIHTADTECAEQAFHWMNELQMGRYKYNFYLRKMVNTHNSNCEHTLNSTGKM